MATSGTTTFKLTGNQLITRAFNLINKYDANDTVSAEDMSLARDLLNSMLKAWENDGLHLWEETEFALFLTYGATQYNLSSTGDNVSLLSGIVTTSLTSSAVATNTLLTVSSNTGISTGMFIGIRMDDGTTFWSTVASISGSTTININDALTQTASSGANVYSYTSKMDRPLRILSVRRISGLGTSENSIPLSPLTRKEYFDMPNRKTLGTPMSYYYDRQTGSGVLYIWQPTNDTSYYLTGTCERQFQDISNSTDDFDFPQEWFQAALYGLAARLGMIFGVLPGDMQRLDAMASQFLQDAKNFDRETGSIYLSPSKYRD